jgi:hypothetical protein
MSDPLTHDRRLFAIVSLLAGVASLLLLGGAASPGGTAAAALEYFRAHQGRYVGVAVLTLVWMVLAIGLVAALRSLLEGERGMLASAATLLCTGGILLLGFAVFAFIGAMFAIVAAAESARDLEAATFHAAVWSDLSFFLTDPGLMALGVGQLAFSLLAWRGRIFPRWLSVVGFVGGAAGALTLAVYQTSTLAIVQLAAFATWGIATGVMLLRRREVLP